MFVDLTQGVSVADQSAVVDEQIERLVRMQLKTPTAK